MLTRCKNRCTFTEVIAKLKLEYRFLGQPDRPVFESNAHRKSQPNFGSWPWPIRVKAFKPHYLAFFQGWKIASKGFKGFLKKCENLKSFILFFVQFNTDRI